MALSSHIDNPDEIVLSYVVERKREDDLISSITDGRFLEQKVDCSSPLVL